MSETTFPCHTCAYREQGPFGHVSEATLKRLAECFSTRRVPAGGAVFTQGGIPRAVYCIESGRVKIVRTTPEGETVVLRFRGPGQLIGYRAILGGDEYAWTAEAIEDVRLFAFEREGFLEILRTSTDLALAMLELVARELRQSQDVLIEFHHSPARARLAHVLLDLSRPLPGAAAAGPVPIHLKKRDLASMLGLSPETLSRALHDFESSGFIQRRGNDILVRQREAIRRLSSGPASAGRGAARSRAD